MLNHIMSKIDVQRMTTVRGDAQNYRVVAIYLKCSGVFEMSISYREEMNDALKEVLVL